MIPAIQKAFKPNDVMTLRELEAALTVFRIVLVSVKGRWIARGADVVGDRRRRFRAEGATPNAATADILRRIGGTQ